MRSFGIKQTAHSVVACQRDFEGQLHTAVHYYVTDDTAHDHHAVNTLTQRAISFLQSLISLRSVIDGCACPQYKGKDALPVYGFSAAFSTSANKYHEKLEGREMNTYNDFSLMCLISPFKDASLSEHGKRGGGRLTGWISRSIEH
ncbi:hypothetical protein PoB_002605300 [Plakobranchus ocellatus]|uniref:Uncharacterized protein n=1 Tax=Plakobranchus ocellatus TaxID=259542 RepID=A0AAV3ZYS2_9GAST|nr:hypothetical protein PoB_002605300 [Plakobranchus ocellatus]